MTNKHKKETPTPKFILDLDKKTETIIRKAIHEYKGELTVLESSLGALIVGQHFGTRVLQICHSQTTIKKYQKVLGIKFTDHCEERGLLASKSVGLNVADKLGSFWKVVTGKEKVEGKKNAE